MGDFFSENNVIPHTSVDDVSCLGCKSVSRRSVVDRKSVRHKQAEKPSKRKFQSVSSSLLSRQSVLKKMSVPQVLSLL